MINNEFKQSMWETWFVISLILIIGVFIIGTAPNSKIIYPHWDIYAVFSVANGILCIVIGTKK